jgi:hypothetical protein
VVKYELETANGKALRDLELLYGTNTSVFKYSNYIKNKKENYNLSEMLAEDLFIDILGQLK